MKDWIWVLSLDHDCDGGFHDDVPFRSYEGAYEYRKANGYRPLPLIDVHYYGEAPWVRPVYDTWDDWKDAVARGDTAAPDEEAPFFDFETAMIAEREVFP